MSGVLKQLRQDHANMAKLLNALERQLAVFDRTERPDYELLQGIMEYCEAYPNLYHHPLEDAVFRKLRDRNPEAAIEVGDQEAEHQILGDLAAKFAEAVDNVLQEVEVPRENFEYIGKELLDFYRHHMKQEDSVFFPAAEQNLTEKDWQEVEAAAAKGQDPLTAEHEEERFKSLRAHLLEWDREDAGQ